MCSANVVARVAEQLDQPVVPVQRVRDQVPVEAADVGRREAEVEPHRAGLELRRQRAALELGGDGAGQLAQHVDVVLGPRERLVVVDAQHADSAPAASIGTPRNEPSRSAHSRAARRRASVRSTSASARGWRGASGVTGTCSSVRSVTCACAAPSSRALSAASRSSASPGASASRRRAASIRRGSSRPARTPSESIPSVSLAFSARRTASASGSAPTSRSNGPTTVQIAFSRSRAMRVDRLHARLGEQLGTPSSSGRTQWWNATRTVPGSSQAANASGPSSAG